jgi:RNA polymerase sigma factor (sigma-70 family)
MSKVDTFQANRRRLFGIAYRMLGDTTEAEDVLQDAYLRWERSREVEEPDSWLTKIVANLCLTSLASARRRRETYVGSWLPAPVSTSQLGPQETAEQRDTLRLGVLRLLERLTPPERLAFVLREAFGHTHKEIAAILETDEQNARQLYHRAKGHVTKTKRRFDATNEQQERVVQRFLAAANGDLEGLEQLLAADATAWFDGGGKVGVPRPPAEGRANVAAYLKRWLTAPSLATADLGIGTVNAQPALLISDAGRVWCVIVPELADGQLVAVYSIANPEKLSHLPPVPGEGGVIHQKEQP